MPIAVMFKFPGASSRAKYQKSVRKLLKGRKKRLADWLEQQRIDGVVFISGDRHFGELLKIARPGAYPLYEFTSSPLTLPLTGVSPYSDVRCPVTRGPSCVM